ncbi:MAG: hypothetical protein ACM30I_15425 [Gemmatimonas sp.]
MRGTAVLSRLALALALTLGACSIPQPFQPDTIPALTEPGVRAGLVVEPFEGAADSGALAAALSEALQGEDVAASTESIPGPAYRMFGRAVPKAGSIEVQWGIEDARGGAVAGGERLLSPLQSQQWRAGDSDLYRGLARAIAAQAASALAETRAGTKDDYTVVVPEVAGAPGDGRRTLQRSMVYVLEKRGLKVVADNAPAPPDPSHALTLRGTMTVTPVNGRSHIEMVWRLLRSDDSEVGKVEQANDVPPGLLRGQWGDIAFAIADAAADGVVNLVDEAAAAPQPESAAPESAASAPAGR